MTNAWTLLSLEPKEPIGVLNDKIVMRFDRYLDWDLLSKHYSFSLDLLRIYQHRVNWSVLLRNNVYDESFLREVAPNFNAECWSIVSETQTLSESFLHTFADKVDWENVVLYQRVTFKFLVDHCKYHIPEGHNVVG